ncbi:tetratricopeptide repeat protein 27 homolog isoform X2 [Rhodamnia argentea]|uniref:Tetratricopeptide repeat protein 27 homolog isoform X2 n=1 Tax=Rhodamnia argentea TaxID=178133 RepID=A0ABM3HND6_9MYRT|nr:tetratricopeptide repeat protein 27 homolog isoform X2 [Rhodamnia argentea]
MCDSDLAILREYELRLLRCTLPPRTPPPQTPSPPSVPNHHLHALIHDLLLSIEAGEYHAALLNSDALRLVFNLSASTLPDLSDSTESAEAVYSDLIDRAESFLVNVSGNEAESGLRVVLVLCVAVAALLVFTQCNITGPLKGFPKCPLPLDVEEYVEWDNWARHQLMSAGSDLLGKFTHLQYIVLAKMLLVRTKDLSVHGTIASVDGLQSMSWWLARVLFIHQRVLDERSSSLFDLLHVFGAESLHHFGNLEKVSGYWGPKLGDDEKKAIVSMVHLEAGMMEHSYGRIDSCRHHFDSAEMAAGLQLSVTGVLGFRTAHQVEAKAQRVLVTNVSSLDDGDIEPLRRLGENNSRSLQYATCETSDVLMTPKLLENNHGDVESAVQSVQNGSVAALPLHAFQQAVILAKCLLIERSSRQDDMQRWDMAPYIETIDSQQSVCFIIRCFCDILRIQWESTRSRTKERALVMMDTLVKGVYEPSPQVAERMFCSFGVYMPTIPALRKEYGEFLIRCGLMGEAVKIFEDLELWDNLIYCYRLLEKKSAAVELIKTRLSVMSNDPRLWCSLGDVTNSDACYEKALEVSSGRSARAKRSLARSAYNKGDYGKSVVLWESAMALNSLYPDGWFALGAAALKARDIEKALDGFTRAVQLDPDNGEAWNNIACLHMIKKRSKEAFIAFKEALKFKRNSWQLWENFSQVAFDVGNINQALEATQMVLKMTNSKRVDAELLGKVTEEIEKRAGCSTDQNQSPDSDAELANESGCTDPQTGILRQTEQLVDSLGKILQQIVRSGAGADMWGLFARWHKMKGDLVMCSEALLKQVRSYQSIYGNFIIYWKPKRTPCS